MTDQFHNLTESLSVLGKASHLSMTQRQKIRDQLFKKIGQAALIDAVATQTETEGLIMPVEKIRNIFQPRRIALSLPAMMSLILITVFGSVATGALAKDAVAGDGALFALRKGLEAFQIALTPDPVAKAEVRLSIASDRVSDVLAVGPVAGPQLDNVLIESNKAIESAREAVVSLQHDDATVTQTLAEKLNGVIASQKEVLGEIVETSTDEVVRQNAIAMIDVLDKTSSETATLISGEEEGDTNSDQLVVRIDDEEEETQIDPDQSVSLTPLENVDTAVNLTGTLLSVLDRPALNVGAATYVLTFNGPISLMRYYGTENVFVRGHLTERGIEVYEININNQLIGEWQPQGGSSSSKNNN